MIQFPEHVVHRIKSKEKAVVLLFLPDEELSLRTKVGFQAYEDKIVSLGFASYLVPVTSKSQGYDELACVRVPQIRVFVGGTMNQKLTGLCSDLELDHLLWSLT